MCLSSKWQHQLLEIISLSLKFNCSKNVCNSSKKITIFSLATMIIIFLFLPHFSYTRISLLCWVFFLPLLKKIIFFPFLLYLSTSFFPAAAILPPFCLPFLLYRGTWREVPTSSSWDTSRYKTSLQKTQLCGSWASWKRQLTAFHHRPFSKADQSGT